MLHLQWWKDSDAGRDWGQEEKAMTEDEMAGWHQRLDGHEFEWTLGVGDGQGGLVCCNSWGRKELDTTERLNWTWLQGLPGNSAGKESACNAGDPGLIPRLGRSPGEGKGYSFQYSGLENSMDCIVHGSTWLSKFHFPYRCIGTVSK